MMLQVKRELKRTRLFEIQKITKRVKMLEKKRGTEMQLKKNKRKVKRVLDELELLKDINLNDLAREVLEESTFTPPEDLRQNAKWRLLSSKPFQQRMSGIKQESGLLTFKPANVAMELHCDTSTEVGHSEESSESAAKENTSVHCDVGDLCVRKREGSSSEDQDTDATSQSNGQDPGVDFHVTSQSAIWGTRAKKIHKTANIKKKVNLSDDANTEAPMHLDSVFLESLATPSSLHPKLKEQKLRVLKNRPGQRARQKKWERKYGSGARHLQKKKRIKSTVSNSARRDGVSKKQVKRSAMGGCQDLHPSWAARRKQKAEETANTKFQGQRILFSDSD